MIGDTSRYNDVKLTTVTFAVKYLELYEFESTEPGSVYCSRECADCDLVNECNAIFGSSAPAMSHRLITILNENYPEYFV